MFKNNNGQVRPGWLIFVTLLVTFIVQAIFMLPVEMYALWTVSSDSTDVLRMDRSDIMFERPWLDLFSYALGYTAALISLLLLWKFLNKKKLHEMGFSSFLKNILFGLLLGAVSIAIIFFILLFTENIQLINTLSNPNFSTYSITYLIFFIFVGLFEELVFRGYIMSTLADRGRRKGTIYIVSALIFGIAHLANQNVTPLGIFNIFLVGILFAYMYDKTQSLWTPIGYHITWNYFQGNIFGFPVSGTTPYGVYTIDVSSGNDILTGGSFGLEGGLLATLLIIFGFICTYLFSGKRV
ncbi:CPBP family intramembrane metalloprotease [Niallia circulans]|uniref:CPBP family intramembrane metalloprotease n=1 Tax=Niallia circulans TaxID=1397 RepID=A0A553SU61_NIACI|nr:CPBP family intramembrane glutamic endopeptidase [Niallia circulans]TRZ40516.1 CPBP family intramembrane metalloprotease [Niallia circulans]